MKPKGLVAAASITSQMSMLHAQAEQFEFVDQGDVHAAENIFEQLGHFRGARGADRHDLRDDLRVQSRGSAAARRIDAADDFRNLRQAVLLVAGIFALGRKGQEEIGRDCSWPFGPAAIGQRRPLASRIGSTSSSVVPG